MKLNQNTFSPGSEQLNFFFSKKEGKSRHVSYLLCFNPVFTRGRMQRAETGGGDKFKSYTVHSN